MFQKLLLVLLALASVACRAKAQQSYGGQPYSFVAEIDNEIPTLMMPELDMKLVAQQDALDDKKGKLQKFGRILSANLTTENGGVWTELPNGDRVWRARVVSSKALALTLYWDDFSLAEGAQLYIYDESHEQLLGAYLSLNNPGGGKFATEMIKGESAIIELYEPYEVRGKSNFTIEGVGHAYRFVNSGKTLKDFRDSGTCNVNVNCPEGANWQSQKKAETRILVVDGTGQGWCSGTVINNTSLDCAPYVLTAFHCGETSTAAHFNQWVFYFDYESATCTTPATEPTSWTMTGCTNVANAADGGGSTGSDFLLLRLNVNIAASRNMYFAGWDRTGVASPNGVSIHHPAGDIKKISTYSAALTSTSYGGTVQNTHWRANWVSTATSYGVTEGGSSGSGLFGSSGLLVGTLTGGPSGCTVAASRKYDMYGKFSYHWATNGTANNRKLAPWLDPINTGATTLLGAVQPCSATAPLDAGIAAIVTPSSGAACGTSVSPIVTLQNFGTTVLTRVTINYRVNTGTYSTYTWTGSLAAGATVNVTLPAITVPGVNYNFTAYTSAPNSGTDGAIGNDSQTAAVAPTAIRTLPFTEGFVLATFPPTGWRRLNPDNDAYSWARATVGNGGQGSAKFDNFASTATSTANPRGKYDWLILPTMDLSVGGYTSASMLFDVSNARYDANSQDSLVVSVSTNCGVSYFDVWADGGATLATVPATTVTFTPTTGQWVRKTIDLTSFIGQGNVTIAFINYSDWGNNTYIDNINISGLTGLLDVNPTLEVRLSPNPSSGLVNLQVQGGLSSEANVLVFDALGRMVFSQQLQAGISMTAMDMSDLANGIYMVSIKDQSGRQGIQKLVINK